MLHWKLGKSWTAIRTARTNESKNATHWDQLDMSWGHTNRANRAAVGLFGSPAFKQPGPS
jgi:hypothetical protein